MLKKLRAWWFRNFILSEEDMFELTTDFKPKLFDILTAGEGKFYTYIGNKKFVQTKYKI